jgi:hypothetical protein
LNYAVTVTDYTLKTIPKSEDKEKHTYLLALDLDGVGKQYGCMGVISQASGRRPP